MNLAVVQRTELLLIETTSLQAHDAKAPQLAKGATVLLHVVLGNNYWFVEFVDEAINAMFCLQYWHTILGCVVGCRRAGSLC